MRIVQATESEIIIDGIVPIDENPPMKKNGKPDSPDPLIRICHRAKKELLEKNGACVAYSVSRPGTHGDKNMTKITFFFSNTGEAEVSSKNTEILRKTELRYCQMMSVLCAEQIAKYLDDLELIVGLA